MLDFARPKNVYQKVFEYLIRTGPDTSFAMNGRHGRNKTTGDKSIWSISLEWEKQEMIISFSEKVGDGRRVNKRTLEISQDIAD